MLIIKAINGKIGLGVDNGNGMFHFRGMNFEIDILKEEIEQGFDLEFLLGSGWQKDKCDYFAAGNLLDEYAKECNFNWKESDGLPMKITRVLSWLKTAKGLCKQLQKDNRAFDEKCEELTKISRDYLNIENFVSEYIKENEFTLPTNTHGLLNKIKVLLSGYEVTINLFRGLEKENEILKAEKERLIEKKQKYDAGNAVWAIYGNEVNRYVVRGAKTLKGIVGDVNSYYCEKCLDINDVFVFEEKKLFPTKDELLKSL